MRLRFCCYSLAASLVLLRSPVAGQELTIKTALAPEHEIGECVGGGAPAPSERSPAAGEVDSLLLAGSRAAILGDHYKAGELLREAARLAPRNAIVAYRLARTYEERGETELAAAEYCRYLAISPAASDSEDVHQRVRDLASRGGEADREELSAAVRAGFEAFQTGRYEAAVLAFGRVLELRPAWASAYFNHGLALQMLGRREAAVADLQRYLELLPQAEDRQAVLSQMQTLRSSPSVLRRSPSPRPGNVLLQGLFVPGLGQLATGRPVAGILVFTAAAGAAYIALQQSPVVATRIGFDPFGNPYEFQDRTFERKHLVAGAIAGVGVVVAAALEAYVHASAQHGRMLPQLRAEGGTRAHSLNVQVEAVPRFDGPGIVFRLKYRK